MMWKQPEFKSAFKNRYQKLHKDALNDAGIEKILNDVAKPIKNVAQRNFEAYPMGDCFLPNNPYQSMFQQVIKDSTWEGQLDSVRVWTLKRLKTLDSLTNTLN